MMNGSDFLVRASQAALRSAMGSLGRGCLFWGRCSEAMGPAVLPPKPCAGAGRGTTAASQPAGCGLGIPRSPGREPGSLESAQGLAVTGTAQSPSLRACEAVPARSESLGEALLGAAPCPSLLPAFGNLLLSSCFSCLLLSLLRSKLESSTTQLPCCTLGEEKPRSLSPSLSAASCWSSLL